MEAWGFSDLEAEGCCRRRTRIDGEKESTEGALEVGGIGGGGTRGECHWY